MASEDEFNDAESVYTDEVDELEVQPPPKRAVKQKSAPAKGKAAKAAKPAPNPAKKVKKGPADWSKVKGKRGALQGVAELPLDVLFTLCENLDFQDVFNLSRSTKLFRSLLVNDRASSKSIWLAALEREGLPSPPEDYSLVRLGAMLFDTTCAGCGKKGQTIDVGLRLRTCSKCKKRLSPVHYLTDETRGALLLSRQWIRRRGRSHYWDADLVALNARVDAAVQPDTDIEDLVRRNAEYQKARKDYLVSIKKDQEANDKFADAVEKWLREDRNDRREELADLKNKRYSFIKNKFKEDGHHSSDYLPALQHSLVAKAETMNDLKWEKIKPTLEAVIAENKTTRLSAESRKARKAREEVVKTIWVEVKGTFQEPYPTIGSLCALQPIDDLIAANDKDKDISKRYEGYKDDVKAAIEAARPGIEQWGQQTAAELIALAGGEDESILDTAVFRCANCATMLVYPALFKHKCLTLQDEEPPQTHPLRSGRTQYSRYSYLGETRNKEFDASDLKLNAQDFTSVRARFEAATQSLTGNGAISHARLNSLGRRFQAHTLTDPASSYQLHTWSGILSMHRFGAPQNVRVHSNADLKRFATNWARTEILDSQPVYQCGSCSTHHNRWQQYQHLHGQPAVPALVADEEKVKELLEARAESIEAEVTKLRRAAPSDVVNAGQMYGSLF